MNVPDLAAVEAYAERVKAAINAAEARDVRLWKKYINRDRILADRALDGLRRHIPERYPHGGVTGECVRCGADCPCPDALDRWADLTAIGTTYGVTQS